MIDPVKADIIPVIKNVVKSLQPYSQANQVYLAFICDIEEFLVEYHPFSLIQSLTHLICNIISIAPVKCKIKVCVKKGAFEQLIVEIENDGINLARANTYGVENEYSFSSCPLPEGTKYSLKLPTYRKVTDIKADKEKCGTINHLPPFYAEIQKRLRSHFTQSAKLVAALERLQPTEATFLNKINALIKTNLHKENFDTNELCKAISMNRTQLFRKLKPLIRQAPANYIKTIRLQKAKELLETTDLTVSEVAFKTGFQTSSNFTKVFQKRYSILPSLFQRSNKAVTNE